MRADEIMTLATQSRLCADSVKPFLVELLHQALVRAAIHPKASRWNRSPCREQAGGKREGAREAWTSPHLCEVLLGLGHDVEHASSGSGSGKMDAKACQVSIAHFRFGREKDGAPSLSIAGKGSL